MVVNSFNWRWPSPHFSTRNLDPMHILEGGPIDDLFDDDDPRRVHPFRFRKIARMLCRYILVCFCISYMLILIITLMNPALLRLPRNQRTSLTSETSVDHFELLERFRGSDFFQGNLKHVGPAMVGRIDAAFVSLFLFAVVICCWWWAWSIRVKSCC